ncbi:Multidrug and toxin extrusion protein 1 [Hibiscus syriacus]|uniref:Multidrug and toxin extrusion protein 1 n=1 Tax=Hibiscus syriacus TaxID=106335 RepID=A0A6A2Y5N7_HIBSY|nr:FCS-Like Zinc finger 15-like [Hibiscus syriacus]KAE8668049.1 Multidrug and toxin extrusion protein 1 [Hibiscus syriacus]
MVGLSVVLEKQSSGEVINKTTMFINTKASHLNYPLPPFLQQCFLCNRKLLPGNDIYMYKGDKGFCSEECRCWQIFMDEEESLKKDKYCSFASTISSSTSSSSSSASHCRRRRHRREAAGDGGNGFAYRVMK